MALKAYTKYSQIFQLALSVLALYHLSEGEFGIDFASIRTALELIKLGIKAITSRKSYL